MLPLDKASVAIVCAAALARASGLANGQDSPVAQVQILSPDRDTYVSGPTLLQAGVQPPGLAASVTFFVDGRQACVLTAPPFECEWDPGPQ